MRLKCVVAGSALLLGACGGGSHSESGGAPQTTQGSAVVAISWTANRETAVNAPGGGYRVYHSRSQGFDVSQAEYLDVPHQTAGTPNQAAVTLPSGPNYIKVVAYSALNASGSEPSAEVAVIVP